MGSFFDQYKHPLWQKKRLEILELAKFECQDCGDAESQLHVHHLIYRKGAKIWEYESCELVALCDSCHKKAHKSKSKLNETICKFGAGAEQIAADLLCGYLYFDGYPDEVPANFGECVGAGAAYLCNLDASDILDLTKINPSLLKEFIRGVTNNG